VKAPRVVVITGMSGSGKTTALRALEDMGFFCVDNMPVVLWPKFLEIQLREAKGGSDVALVMDLREQGFLGRYARIFQRLKDKGFRIEILFLDASDEALLHRFSETRRVHPMALQGTVMEGVEFERSKLGPLKAMADKVLDTTSYNVHQLKDAVQRLFLSPAEQRRMVIHVTSFGYRFGLPPDADIVLDIRFLPNPHFDKNLRMYDGHHPRVREYVLTSDTGEIFVRKLFDLMEFLIPLYEKEGKSRFNIAIGCTGGRHRSVVMANELVDYFSQRQVPVNVHHRDIAKS
jgi:UPF0042 nucleotide-binding protein